MARAYRNLGPAAAGLVLAALASIAAAAAPRPTQDDRGLSSADAAWAARVLPDSIVAYAEFRGAGQAWRTAEASSLCRAILEAPQMEAIWSSQQAKQMQQARAMLESVLESPLPQLLDDLTAAPMIVAVDRNRQVSLLAHPTPQVYERLRETLADVATASGLGAGNQRPLLQAVTYRDVPAFAAHQLRVAFYNGWILASPSRDLAKSVLDRAIDGASERSLAAAEWFQKARAWNPAPDSAAAPVLAAWVDLKGSSLRIPAGKDLGQELIVGGVTAALSEAPYAVATLGWEGDRIRAQLALPWNGTNDPLREYFFGAGATAPCPAPSDVAQRVASFRWHRDLGLFWNLAPQLIDDDETLAGLAKSESDLSTLLGGMSSVSEVLNFIGPDLELVVCQPEEAGEDAPEIRLPTFAFVGELRETERAQAALRLAFQQVVSFSNLNAGAGRYPPLEVVSEQSGGTTTLAARYVMLKSAAGEDEYRSSNSIYKNFSPTLLFRGDRFVLSSDRALGERLIDTPPPAAAGGAWVENTVIEISPREVARLIEANRDAITAQRMLQTGRGETSAAAELELGLAVLRALGPLRVELATGEQTLRLAAVAELQ